MRGGGEAEDTSLAGGMSTFVVKTGVVVLLMQAAAMGWALSGEASAEVKLSTTIKFYPVHGTTRQEVREQIKRLGPVDGFDGHKGWARTDGNVDWTWWYKSRNGKCEIEKVLTEVSITYTYPEWKDLGRSPAALQESWHRTMKALRRHEEHHGQYAIDAGNQIDAAISALKPRESCDALGKAAEALGHSVLEKARQLNIDYDRRTSHGSTEIPFF